LIDHTSPMSANPSHIYIHICRLQGIHLAYKLVRLRQFDVRDPPLRRIPLVISFTSSTMISS
jgi:hypothetical protein